MNALYPFYRQQLLQGAHHMDTDVIRAALIASGAYSYSPAHRSYATDVPPAAKVAESARLTAPGVASGVFDSADFTWLGVTGPPVNAIILWNDTLPAKALVAFYDSGIAGLPVTPTGVDINVTVNASGWFAL
jgi:hypothetical protein